MKYLLLVSLVGGSVYYYMLNQAAPKPPTELEAENEGQDIHRETTAVPVQQKRMVQIHGKWYEHRADNTYLIDGVPTLFIPQKSEAAAPPAVAPAKTPTRKTSSVENPARVYTPTGFAELQSGLETAKNAAAERAKALEEFSRED